jgi:hypothetical protein
MTEQTTEVAPPVYIEIAEFQRGGFLQEANRQFFHPLGLALEATIRDEEHGAITALSLSDEDVAALRLVLAQIDPPDTGNDERDRINAALARARRYDVGQGYLSGVWDYRDDPEGMIFGDLTGDEVRAKALAVQQELERHVAWRLATFNGEIVQPIGSATCAAKIRPFTDDTELRCQAGATAHVHHGHCAQ